MGRSVDEVSKAVERAFGDKEYLKVGWTDEEATPMDAQEYTFTCLEKDTHSASKAIAGRAFFELALAYSLGFGVQMDVNMALKCALEAAFRGYLPAKAICHTWHAAHLRTMDVDEETQLDWLYDACIWGSGFASHVLKGKNPSVYRSARQMFHQRGGFNQYFYDCEPPAHIGSKQFISALAAHGIETEPEHLNALLKSATIYGDVALAQQLVQHEKIDLALTTAFGESLLLLCCKGGHIDVLQVLPLLHFSCLIY